MTGELEAKSQPRRDALDAFVTLSEASGTETDLYVVARRALDVMQASLPELSVAYYDLEDGRWRAKVTPDDMPPAVVAILRAGLATTTPGFAAAVEAKAPLFTDGWDAHAPHFQPTEPYGAAAFYPFFRGDQPSAMLVVGTQQARTWSPRDREIFRAVGRSVELAFKRTEQEEVRRIQALEAKNAELEEERAALAAFVRFTETSTQTTDPLSLAADARDVLEFTLGVQVGYSELEDGRWKGRIFSANTPPEVVVQAREGFPADLPSFLRPFQTGDVVFVDGWNGQEEGAEHTEVYGAAALYPYFKHGSPHGLLTMGTPQARQWTERERSVFRAVGRSLGLAFERTEQAQHLVAQNAELAARTRALEAFAHLTQDLALHSDPYALILRAQEVTLSLLTPGYALYYEPEGERWRSRVQVGDVGNANLQAFIDAGPLVGETPNLDVPWTTRQPQYQDDYERGSDTPAEIVQHVTTVASLPVFRHGAVVGIFIAVLFGARRWTPTDRVILETVMGSVGLALERAKQAGELRQRTTQLERSNAELEQFAYIASHDLQAPIRAVTSFAGIIERRYGEGLDERGRLYLRQIVDSGEHMKRLVDDLLTFSRVQIVRRAWLPVDAQVVFDSVAQRLQAQIPDAAVSGTALPTVLADAPQLDQLLQNLISNGLKYRREQVLPQVKVSAERVGTMWRFAVSDNGIGIEPQYFERIFEIFQRLHGRDVYEGTGIGLAVCKKIVESHGGQLWLNSTVGKGSTFFFTLPAVRR